MDLEKIIIKVCEKLPLNLTLFEDKGYCKKEANQCKYCSYDFMCYKKGIGINNIKQA